MKKLWVGLFLLILCFMTHLSLSWAQEATGPRMVITEKAADYPEVDEGEVIEHVFKVFNTGDQPLQIEKVKPG
ncbi:MAG: hypothetical protein PVH82_18540 [Desulfobacteraceae bacterium]|jgi:hypothetical protein